MSSFPRTTVGGVSVSRMIIGTNWFLGFSHCTPSKDDFIREHMREPKQVADILEVFFRAGVDTLMGLVELPPLVDAIKEAEDRTGVECIVISTPTFPITETTPTEGFDADAVAAILDRQAENGVRICMPHVCTTDCLVDRCTRTVRRADDLLVPIRERGMIPGWSTHMPETIVFSDERGLDVESYISLYNAMGFLMQMEVDWVSRIIHEARKPVMTIKPMASGQLRPFQALNFVWNTLRDQDMVTVGTFTPKEAAELVELSVDILAKRTPDQALQETRSKASVMADI